MAEVTETNPLGAGRPHITEEEKKEIVSKLEPYLKSGLSVSKSLLEAGVSKASFYRLMNDDEQFRDKIDQFRNFTAVLLNNAIISELQVIFKKQQGYKDPRTGKMIPPAPLKKDDREFLWKYALTSNLTRGEYGERKEVQTFDPEAELQKIKGLIEEATKGKGKELPPIESLPVQDATVVQQ